MSKCCWKSHVTAHIFKRMDKKIFTIKGKNAYLDQGCGYTMPDLSDLVPFPSGQVENLNLFVLGQVQNLY